MKPPAFYSRNGDPQTLQQLSALGFHDGTYCAEGIIGTCALSLAAISGQAVKTMADQHFKQATLELGLLCNAVV